MCSKDDYWILVSSLIFIADLLGRETGASDKKRSWKAGNPKINLLKIIVKVCNWLFETCKKEKLKMVEGRRRVFFRLRSIYVDNQLNDATNKIRPH